MLAPDQRYCVECGARRHPLSPYVANMIAALQPDEPSGEEAADEESPTATAATGFRMPTPRAIAIAIMGMLAFGVAIGAIDQPIGIGHDPGANRPGGSASDREVGAGRRRGARARARVANLRSGTGHGQSGHAQLPKSSKQPELPSTALPPVKHVFLITLANQGFNQAFGPSSAAPYLAQTLVPQGELLPNYYAVTQGELANEIALLSGQGPTQQTAADCSTYTDVAPGTTGRWGRFRDSDGCVYATGIATLPDQLTAAGKTWKAYVEGIGNPCRHPTLGQADASHTPQPNDPYTTWSNPFVYFHSITDNPSCSTNDVGIDQLGPI